MCASWRGARDRAGVSGGARLGWRCLSAPPTLRDARQSRAPSPRRRHGTRTHVTSSDRTSSDRPVAEHHRQPRSPASSCRRRQFDARVVRLLPARPRLPVAGRGASRRLQAFAASGAPSAPAASSRASASRRSALPGIYLDGGFGVGKTHLLAALWHAAPGAQVLRHLHRVHGARRRARLRRDGGAADAAPS